MNYVIWQEAAQILNPAETVGAVDQSFKLRMIVVGATCIHA